MYSCLETMFDEDEERGLGASELVVSKTQPPDDDSDDGDGRSEGGGRGEEGEGGGKGKQEDGGEKGEERAAKGDGTNGRAGSEGGAVGSSGPKGVPVGLRRSDACWLCHVSTRIFSSVDRSGRFVSWSVKETPGAVLCWFVVAPGVGCGRLLFSPRSVFDCSMASLIRWIVANAPDEGVSEARRMSLSADRDIRDGARRSCLCTVAALPYCGCCCSRSGVTRSTRWTWCRCCRALASCLKKTFLLLASENKNSFAPRPNQSCLSTAWRYLAAEPARASVLIQSKAECRIRDSQTSEKSVAPT